MDWEDLRIFSGLAQHGTARKTAAALSIHYTTVCRRLDALEADLGTRLFDRMPDGYVLTSAGEQMLETVQPFERDVEALTRRLSGHENALSGKIRVTMPEPVAVHIFAPVLAGFLRLYPDLELEFELSDAFLDLSRREADVAIRLDNNPPDYLIGRRLFKFAKTAYASPKYLASHDLVAHPEDARWLGWDRAAWLPESVSNSPYPDIPVWGQFPSMDLQQAAARAGLGLVMLPCAQADQDPGLVRVPGAASVPGQDVWVLTHPELKNTARIRVFMDFAVETLLAAKETMNNLAHSAEREIVD